MPTSSQGSVSCQFSLRRFFPSLFLLFDLCLCRSWGGDRPSSSNLLPDSLCCLEYLLHLHDVTTVILYVLVLPSWHCSWMRWVRLLSLTQRQSWLLLRRAQNFLLLVPPIQFWSMWAGRHSPAHTSSLMGLRLVQWPSEMYLVDLSSLHPIWFRSVGRHKDYCEKWNDKLSCVTIVLFTGFSEEWISTILSTWCTEQYSCIRFSTFLLVQQQRFNNRIISVQ